MDIALRTLERGRLSGFLFRWLGAWMIPVALSSLLLGIFFVFDVRYHLRPSVFLLVAALLSLPAFAGLLHGIVMRGILRRSTLWGALTCGGVVIAAVSVEALPLQFLSPWLRVTAEIAWWLAHTLGLALVPEELVRTIAGALLLGFILGAAQAAALGFGWPTRALWIAASGLAAIPMMVWADACMQPRAFDDLFARIASSMPLTGEWRYVPVTVALALVGAFSFALPTGLVMNQLLRRHQRADAEALVRRFE
jgi:hypothetical protein